MEQTDDTVGRVLAALKANGFAENTLVIFSADNGAEHYAYPRIQNFAHRSSGPLRGVKRDLWEGGHRVPFIVRWPGIVPKNETTSALVSQVDLMATIASITGFALPVGSAEDSYDLLPVLKSGAPSPRRSIIHNTDADGYAVRHDQWLFVAAKTGGISRVPAWFDLANDYKPNEQPGELFDLSRDLAQRHNLHSQQPGKVAELSALLAEMRAHGQAR